MTHQRHFLLWICLCATAFAFAQDLTIGTYNIRLKLDFDAQRGDHWNTRKQSLIDLLNYEAPDVFGTQEGLHDQLEDMKKGLTGYSYVGVGRDDGKTQGEYAAIFYNTKRLLCLKEGTFWLSPTPERPGKGWDAAYTRICTWGIFRIRESGNTFLFVNLHADNEGKVARAESAKMVLKRIPELAGKDMPVVLTGDFNVDQHSEPYQIIVQSSLLKDSYTLAQHRFAPNGTYQDFKPGEWNDSRIDHVFVSPQFEVHRYAILTAMYWTKETATQPVSGDEKHTPTYRLHTPSDHYPVFVKVTLPTVAQAVKPSRRFRR